MSAIPRHRRSGLGLRLTLLFALIFVSVVLLTDALLYVNYRTVELNRGQEALADDASLLTELLGAGGTLSTAAKRVAEGRSDALVIWRSGAGEIAWSASGFSLDPNRLPGEPRTPAGRSSASYYRYRDGDGGATDLWLASAVREDITVQLVSRLRRSREAISEFGFQLFALSAVIAVVGFWIMVMVGASVTRPIVVLTAVARRLADGDLSARAGVSRGDEIGTLLATFDSMAEGIERAEERRRAFISDVSHELRAPLASVKAVVESLIAGTDSPEEMRDYLVAVDREVDRMAGLLRSFVTFTRLGGMEPRPVPVSIARAAGRLIRLLEPRAKDAGVRMSVQCPQTFTVNGDPDMIDEILLNVVDNALRHGGRGISVTVGAGSSPEGKSFWVENTGPTLASDLLTRLFESPAPCGQERSRDLSGRGLGLAIVQRIAQAHGWSVSVRSNDGLTRFTVATGEPRS